MSVITKGKTFANGEQLTAGKLNQMLDAAVFSAAAVDNTKTTLSGGAITIAPNAITTTEIAQSFLDTIYPIGSIYTNATDSTNPGTLLGFGTWEEFAEGRVPVGKASSGTFDTAGNTGGAEEVTLAASDIPPHSHKFQITGDSTPDSGTNGGIMVSGTGSTVAGTSGTPSDAAGEQIGGNNLDSAQTAHNNLQPYIVVYMWKRTA
jgi:hypothetical protein